MNRRPHAIALVAMLSALLAGCYRPPEAPPGSSAAATPAPFPPGVDQALAGIYTDPGNPCCWLARDASFQTTVPAGAKHLTLTVFTPDDIPKLRKAHQRVTVTVEKQKQSFAAIPLGTKTLQLALKPAASPRPALVMLHMDVTFTPKEELGSTDTRTLSIYLKSVRAW